MIYIQTKNRDELSRAIKDLEEMGIYPEPKHNPQKCSISLKEGELFYSHYTTFTVGVGILNGLLEPNGETFSYEAGISFLKLRGL